MSQKPIGVANMERLCLRCLGSLRSLGMVLESRKLYSQQSWCENEGCDRRAVIAALLRERVPTEPCATENTREYERD